MSDRPRPPPRPPSGAAGQLRPLPFPPTSRVPGAEALLLPSASPRLPLPGRGRASRPRPGPVGPQLSAVALGAQGASLGSDRLPPETSRLQQPFLFPSPLPEAGAVPAGRGARATCGFPRGTPRPAGCRSRARSGPGRGALPSAGGAFPASRGPAAAAPWPLPLSHMCDSGLGKRRAARAGPELCEVPESIRLEKTSDITQSEPCEMMESFGSMKCGCAGWGIEEISRVER